MALIKIDVWALPHDGEPTPLPDLDGWEVGPGDTDDTGTIEIDYPVEGRGYELLAAVADDEADLPVEIRFTASDGRTWTKPGFLLDLDTDDVEETGKATLTGLLHEHIFAEVVIPYHPTGENGNTPVSGSAGRIMRELLEAAQGRGCLTGLTWTFTDTEDSAGAPWERPATLAFKPGQLYRAVLGTLRGYQLSEWELAGTLDNPELRLYNIDGKGVDRTTGANPLTLERGRDLGDAPRKFSLRDAITDLLSSGSEGLYSLAENLTARARRGRRIEGYHSFGSTADQGTLDALTQARLTTQVFGTTSVSHDVVLAESGVTPLFDFGPADWINSAGRRGVSRRRVVQITLSGTGSVCEGAAVDLDAVFDSYAVAQQRRLDALADGSVVVGTSVPTDVDDGSTPESPAGASVVATSLWYASGEGVGQASITAAWTPVPDSRITGYAAEWRYVNGALGSAWRRQPVTDLTTASWSSVVAGAAVQVRVYSVNRWGRYSAPSTPAYEFVTELDGTPPPIASTLTLITRVGQVWVTWDGAGSAGQPMPGDFLRGELHRSTTSGFTPNRPLLADGKTLDEQGSTTYRGELRAGMTFPDQMAPGDYGTTFFYRLVLVDRSQNATAAGAQASIVAVPVQDGEVATINAGKITAGIINAIVGIGQRLYAGNPAGAGWEGDPAGFRFYSMIAGTRQTVLEFVAATASLMLTGTFQSGKTGRRVLISGGSNEVKFMPQAGETRFGRISSFIPSNYPNDISVAVEASDTDSIDIRGRVEVRPEIALMACLKQDNPVLGTSFISAEDHVVQMSSRNDSSQLRSVMRLAEDAVEASVRVTGATTFDGGYLLLRRDSAGPSFVGHRLDSNNESFLAFELNGDIRFNKAIGTTSNGLSFKAQFGYSQSGYRFYIDEGANTIRFVDNQSNAFVGDGAGGLKSFVIPHPLDDERWLVHGCVESPTAALLYEGEAEVTDHHAIVELPAWFEAAARPEGRRVQLTVIVDDQPDDLPAVEPVPPTLGPARPDQAGPLDHGVIGVPVIPEWARLPAVAASVPRHGRFRIACSTERARVHWSVTAQRADVEPLEAEPRRADVHVHGDGPYRYLATR